MDTTELELELLDLKEKHKYTRNNVEKTLLADQIEKKQKEIADAKLAKEEPTANLQKDVPVVADHKNESDVRPGYIANSGDTFTTLL